MRGAVGWLAGLIRRAVAPRGPLDRPGLGRAGERAAARFLRRAGYRILARNVRLRFGEADLVCRAPDRRTIVVVEVKTRIPAPGGSPPPEASVHARKRRTLRGIARALARLNRWPERGLRVDVVAVEWPADGRGRPTIRHHIGAVTRGRTKAQET